MQQLSADFTETSVLHRSSFHCKLRSFFFLDSSKLGLADVFVTFCICSAKIQAGLKKTKNKTQNKQC